nr:hypothetical protein [Tanacetum cinerariifolium]
TIPTTIPADVSTIVHVVSEMTDVVAPPFEIFDLNIHATSKADPFEDPSSSVHALVAPITSSFLYSDSSEPSGYLFDRDSPDSLSPPDSHESGDIKRDAKSDIDSDILADIEAGIATEVAVAIKADDVADAVAAAERVRDDEAEIDVESSARGTFEIRVDVLTEPEFPDCVLV